MCIYSFYFHVNMSFLSINLDHLHFLYLVCMCLGDYDSDLDIDRTIFKHPSSLNSCLLNPKRSLRVLRGPHHLPGTVMPTSHLVTSLSTSAYIVGIYI